METRTLRARMLGELKDVYASGILGATFIPLTAICSGMMLVWSIHQSATGEKPGVWLIGIIQFVGFLNLLYHHPRCGFFLTLLLGEFRFRPISTTMARVSGRSSVTDHHQLNQLVDRAAWPYGSISLLGERFVRLNFEHEGVHYQHICLRVSQRLFDTLAEGDTLPIAFQVSRDPFQQNRRVLPRILT